ncbi:MAG: alpha-glucosidase/alpha-galactosidase [Anaerolineaceae bacterium]|jgi:alpha-galactosidase|nr:alpha-glucosidase/alpha-galactosidase [Anaerolineaceae bacterium]
MTVISFIGAGSVVFTRNLCNDILLVPAFQDSTIRLMDIHEGRLSIAYQTIQSMVARRGLKTRVEATMDMREAVRGADYVVTTFQQGGVEAYALDIEIPQKYGVEQCVGDTIGPGGVFRGLRTIPVLLTLCEYINEVAPDALLLNYVNPMAINCWAVYEATGRPVLGLCHSVQDTSKMLAGWLKVTYSSVDFLCAGINHQSFFLEFEADSKNLYPQLKEISHREEIYGLEPVRIDLMDHFGYFVTESSGHASEYVPYFRKNAHVINENLAKKFTSEAASGWFDFGRSGGYLKNCRYWENHMASVFSEALDEKKPLVEERTHEYGSYIMEAMETNQPVQINGNVKNDGLITNLPDGCCVEVPCQIDSAGIQPQRVGKLPTQLAALNRNNINVQELTVQAALTGDRDAVYHAIKLDPLTAAVCTLPQIDAMVTEMLQAQARWMPDWK